MPSATVAEPDGDVRLLVQWLALAAIGLTAGVVFFGLYLHLASPQWPSVLVNTIVLVVVLSTAAGAIASVCGLFLAFSLGGIHLRIWLKVAALVVLLIGMNISVGLIFPLAVCLVVRRVIRRRLAETASAATNA